MKESAAGDRCEHCQRESAAASCAAVGRVNDRRSIVNRRRPHRSAAVNAVANDQPIPLGRIDDPTTSRRLRAAIALRAAQPGTAAPSDEFVDRLHDELDGPPARPATPPTAIVPPEDAHRSGRGWFGSGRRRHRCRRRASPMPPSPPIAPVLGANRRRVGRGGAPTTLDANATRFEARGVVGFVSAHGDAVQRRVGCVHAPRLPAQRERQRPVGLIARAIAPRSKRTAPSPTSSCRRACAAAGAAGTPQGGSIEVLLPPSAA